MKLRLIILFLLVCLVSGLSLVWYREGLKPVVANDSVAKPFTIEVGTSVRDIADRLERQGFIRSKLAFFIYIRLAGLAQTIQAGVYSIAPSMDAKTIAHLLTRGSNDIQLTTLEGWRIDEIATKINKELSIPEREFLRYAKEGYMFPDTYKIPRNATAAAIAKIFEDTFKQKVTVQMRQDALKQGLNMDEVVILASIVEREGKSDIDRPVIAGILKKRLKADWPLQADSTLQYILGYQSRDKTWWKKVLTEEDKLTDSLYNTYKYPGLPPGPISNPGLAAIKAVIYPLEKDYWYYLHTPDGKVYYSKTLEEHQQNIEKYL